MIENQRRQAVQQVRDAANLLRTQARLATPGEWRALPANNGAARVVGRAGQQVAMTTGHAAADTAIYLTSVAPTISYVTAELMERAAAAISRGELPTGIQAQVEQLAAAVSKALTGK